MAPSPHIISAATKTSFVKVKTDPEQAA